MVLLLRLVCLRLLIQLAISVLFVPANFSVSQWLSVAPSCAWLCVALAITRRLLCTTTLRRFALRSAHFSDAFFAELLLLQILLITADPWAVVTGSVSALALCSRSASIWNITSDGNSLDGTWFNRLFSAKRQQNTNHQSLSEFFTGIFPPPPVRASFFPRPPRADNGRSEVGESSKQPKEAPGRPVAGPPDRREYQPSADEIQQLVGMGFDEEMAARALRRTNGDVNAAFNLLFDGQIDR